MATLFLDFENGNNNHAGTSFALLAQGTNGRITTATFSSTGATFPNDGSLIGQYLSIFNGTIYAVYNITAWVSSTSLTIAAISGGTALANQAVDRQYYIGGRWKNITTGATAVRTIPSDTIRIMGSPAPTSLGQNGVWTSQALQATKSITSSTNATPISVTSTAHGYATGDTVVITGVTTNTNANGTWEVTVTGVNTFTLGGSVGNGVGGATGSVRLRNNTRVRLASAVTQNIASTGPGRAAWTAVAGGNITIALDTALFKEHRDSDSIAIAAGFTTGLAAYWPTGTIDLSGYQQVSFWIRQTTGIIGAAGAVDLRLCSDAAGVTAVNTINIPSLAATGRWMPVTVDLGTNLGSSIQSIALYVNTDNGAQTFVLNNIIACKASSAADSLTLTSLIGKNTTGETFWGIQSINGTRVMLDADTNAAPNSSSVMGYYGTSETVTTWKRETIKLGPAAAQSTALQTIQESGTDGSPITYSGGWDRTAMSTQNLETWLDGVNGNGLILSWDRRFVNVSTIAAVRASYFNSAAMAQCNWDILAYNNCTNQCFNLGSSGCTQITATIRFGCANNAAPLRVANGSENSFTIGKILSIGANGLDLGSGSQVPAINALDSTSIIANCAGSGIVGAPQFISGLTTSDNIIEGFGLTNASANAYCKDCLFNEANEVSVSNYFGGRIFSHNHDQVTGNHKIFFNGALISSATDQRNTASGISWKIQPTSTTFRSASRPVIFSLAKVACAANSLVTIKAWMRRDNAGLTMHLVCKGGQITGVASDVTASVTTTNAWEEETITFTPTETGVVEITAEAWGGSTFSGWVDDMTISQA